MPVSPDGLTWTNELPYSVAQLVDRGGAPGLEYALVPVEMVFSARQDDWRTSNPHPDSPEMLVEGPRGSLCVRVMWRGKVAEGASPESGSRVLWIEQSIYEVTGINPDGTLKESTNAVRSQGKVDDAPVQAPQEAQQGPSPAEVAAAARVREKAVAAAMTKGAGAGG